MKINIMMLSYAVLPARRRSRSSATDNRIPLPAGNDTQDFCPLPITNKLKKR